MPFHEQMEKLAQAVRETINPIDRASVATELFGESGKAMLPLLTQGAVGMRNFMNEAKATGQVMTGEQAGKAAAAQRALTSAYESARKAVVEVGMALIPSTEVIAKFSAYFEQGAAAVRDFIRANGGTIAVVAGAAVGVVALGTAVTAVGGIVAGVATAFGALVTAVTTVISVGAGIVGAILSPLGLIVVAVVAVVAAFLLLTDAGGEACDFLGDAFDELADVFGEAWGAIVTAVKAGDLSAAFAVVTSTLDLMLRRAVVKMTQAWNDFKGFFVDAWHDGLMLIELGMEAASTEIAKTMMDMLAFIAKNFSDTFNAIVEGAAKVADALNATETAATIRGAKDLVKLDTDGMKKMIDEDHNAANKKIFKDRAGQQDASDQSRGDDLKGAKSALVDAEAAFAKALGDAAEAGEKSEREKREKAAADKGPAASDGPKKPAALSNGELPSLSRGTFTSTSYGQMFAAPSVAGRQLREQEKTNEILKDVVKAVRENGDQEAATFK